jgi:Transposase DDE domain
MSLSPGALASRLSRDIGLSNDRRLTFCALLVGLISARTVNLSHLAGAFCGPAKLASNYRRLQRFFQYVRLDADWLARTLVGLLCLAPPYRLCLDRTNWKIGSKDVNLLVLCIAANRARIPVLWHVLGHGGSSTMAQRQELVTRFIALFGKGSVKLLLADREFVGSQWFDFLAENGIPFSIRVRGGLNVRLNDGYEGPLERLASTRFGRSRLMKAKGCFEDMEPRFASALTFAATELCDGSLLILAASCGPKKALNAYRKRWQIECLFGDTKTRGFNMEDTRLTQPAKLSLLLALVALAMAWSIGCAQYVKGKQEIPRASHGHRRKSWFRTGFDTIRHWIAHQPARALALWAELWKRAGKTVKKRRVV